MTTDTLVNESMAAEPAAAQSLDGVYCRLVAAATEESPAVYRWRQRREGHWLAEGEDTLDAIVQAVDDPLARWLLVLPGDQVITRRLTLAENERRFYKKLAPYQLEEDIIDDVDELHFVYGELGDDWVNLAYTRRDQLADALAAFHARELAVTHIVSDADLLPATQPGIWTLYSDGQQLAYRLAPQLFGSVRLSYARAFLASAARASKPEQIRLLAAQGEAMDQLLELLPEGLADKVAFKSLLAEPLAADEAQVMNLAVAPFFPRMPLARWFERIKLPLIAAAAAVVLHLGLTLTEWQLLRGQTEDLKTAITERYRAAVPNGAISDPLKQLRNQVSRLGNQSSGSNALFILSQSVPVLVEQPGVEVKNLQFLNDAQELRLTVQAPALSDIEAMSNQLKTKGFGAEVLSVNVNQGVHQARMKVTRR